MKSTSTKDEDLEQFINETIRLNQCCPRFNNTLTRYPSSVDDNAPPDSHVVDRSIPAFLRKYFDET